MRVITQLVMRITGRQGSRISRLLPRWIAMAFALVATPATAQTMRLPPVAPAPMDQVGPRMHVPQQIVPAAAANRITELEQRLLEVEARLQDKPPAEPASDPGYLVGSELGMKASWKNGLEIESPHKDFRVHIGGRTQVDAIWLDGDPAFYSGAGGVGDADSVSVRRGRLRIDGTMYEFIDWAVEYDLFNSVNNNVGLQPASEVNGNVVNVPVPTDLWWDIKELPVVGHFRIGNFKEPIGLEHQTSSRFLDFMERSFLQDAFTGPFNNGFTPGMMFWESFESTRLHYELGVFKNANNVFAFDTGDGEYAVDGRLAWLPYYDEPAEGRYLVHLGIAGSYRDLDEDRIRIRSRGSLRNGPSPLNPVLADTGTFLGDSQTLGALEAAAVWGPLLVQAEYIASQVSEGVSTTGTSIGDYFCFGYYVEALYFLTGEHQAYDHHRFAFGRVVPHSKAYLTMGRQGICHGPGAWQIGLRYSQLDLRDENLDGGVLQDVTLGINWFLNPNMKVQWNLVQTYREAPAGGTSADDLGFGMRVAHDF